MDSPTASKTSASSRSNGGQASPQTTVINGLTEKDVTFGRGNLHHHKGNITFRNIVKESELKYRAATCEVQKKQIVAEIFRRLVEDEKMLFKERRDGSRTWTPVISEDKIKEKIRQLAKSRKHRSRSRSREKKKKNKTDHQPDQKMDVDQPEVRDSGYGQINTTQNLAQNPQAQLGIPATSAFGSPMLTHASFAFATSPTTGMFPDSRLAQPAAGSMSLYQTSRPDTTANQDQVMTSVNNTPASNNTHMSNNTPMSEALPANISRLDVLSTTALMDPFNKEIFSDSDPTPEMIRMSNDLLSQRIRAELMKQNPGLHQRPKQEP